MFPCYRLVCLVCIYGINFSFSEENSPFQSLKMSMHDVREWCFFGKLPDAFHFSLDAEEMNLKNTNQFISYSRMLFNFVAPEKARYPYDVEKSALSHDEKSVISMITMWLYLVEQIEMFQSTIADEHVEKYSQYAEACAVFWMKWGESSQIAECHYYLSSYYRKHGDVASSERHAHQLIKMMENKKTPCSERDYIFLMRCYAWGCHADPARVQEIYQMYEAQCIQNRKRPLKFRYFINEHPQGNVYSEQGK